MEHATGDSADDAFDEVKQLRALVEQLTTAFHRERKEKEAIKTQAESWITEYNRLAEEHSKLQKKIIIRGESVGSSGNGGTKNK